MNTISIGDKNFEPLLGRQEIEARINEMAISIDSAYKGLDWVAVCVLKGAFMFFTDLVKAIPSDIPLGFIRVSSYTNTQTSGKVKQVMGLSLEVKNKHLLVIDDILDTGHTFAFIRDELLKLEPASVEFATLLYKKVAVQNGEIPAYYGFEIPNVFVVGYGLDYNEKGRNYTDIYKLKID